MRKEVEKMKKYGLIGLGLVLLVIAVSMVPVSAVPMKNVTIYAEIQTDEGPVTVKLYEHLEGLSPASYYCLKNDSMVNLIVVFELNHTIPDTYTIRFIGQPVRGTNFDFSNSSLVYIKRTNMTTSQTFDFTTKTVIRSDLIAGRPSVFIIGTIEGNQTNLFGNQKFEIKIRNVKSPPIVNESYHIAMSLWDYEETPGTGIQYGEYTAKLCTAPVIVIPPAPVPQVLPCGCTYKSETIAGNQTLMQAVPEACFKLRAPYQDGYQFLGFKKFVNNLMVPVEVIDVSNANVTYDLAQCIRYEPQRTSALNISYSFTSGHLNWVNQTQWQWGQPVDLFGTCNDALRYKAWGLNLSGNYTEVSSANLTSPNFSGACKFNGSVSISFLYSSYLAPGDVVYVEGWNGTHWTLITTITNASNGCMRIYTGSFDMNASGTWDYTKIRFRFVPNGDGGTDLGFYVFELSLVSEYTCTVNSCAQYKPLYYETDCQCLENYNPTINSIAGLNSVHTVWAEAVYRVNATGAYTYNLSRPLVIKFDNTPPTIRAPQETATSVVFTITDNIVGVEANNDTEPLKVKYKDVGFDFKRWPIYQGDPGTYYYYYDLYDPLKQTRSVAIHFDRLELGYSDELYVYGGCYDCTIFYYWDCGYKLYDDWGSYYSEACVKSAWVRVPLNNCEMNCSMQGVCDNCDYTVGCDDCAKIEFYDDRTDSAFGISIDLLAYGTGIAVLKNGVDITAQCTITSDGFNATVSIPKTLLSTRDEVVVVATDKVGNANYYKYVVGTSAPTPTPTPTPPQEPWQAYDQNGNGDIEDQELISAIMDWLNNRITDQQLINVILKWLT